MNQYVFLLIELHHMTTVLLEKQGMTDGLTTFWPTKMSHRFFIGQRTNLPHILRITDNSEDTDNVVREPF